MYTYSYSQMRGSVPFYWGQDNMKARVVLSRSLDSSEDAFIRHSESVFKDYEGDSFLIVNLLS
jgi:hypothetical protein